MQYRALTLINTTAFVSFLIKFWKNTIPNSKKWKYHRENTMPKTEVILIIIFFQTSGSQFLKYGRFKIEVQKCQPAEST